MSVFGKTYDAEENIGVTTDINIWLQKPEMTPYRDGQSLKGFCKELIEVAGIKNFMMSIYCVHNYEQVSCRNIEFEVNNLDPNSIKENIRQGLIGIEYLFTIEFIYPKFYSPNFGGKEVLFKKPSIIIRGS